MEAVRSETGFPIGHIHKERAASGLSALGRCLCRVLLPERKSVADGGSEQEYRVALSRHSQWLPTLRISCYYSTHTIPIPDHDRFELGLQNAVRGRE